MGVPTGHPIAIRTVATSTSTYPQAHTAIDQPPPETPRSGAPETPTPPQFAGGHAATRSVNWGASEQLASRSQTASTSRPPDTDVLGAWQAIQPRMCTGPYLSPRRPVLLARTPSSRQRAVAGAPGPGRHQPGGAGRLRGGRLRRS